MAQPAILVENLGKRFLLNYMHQPLIGRLTEVISDAARSLLHRPARSDPDNEFWAIRNIDFQVNEGEALGIIGKNGAGKSTLLKVLSRVLEPNEGHAEIYGRVSSLLEVGVGFHPELTGRENVFLNGAILGMSRKEIQSKLDEIVAFAEVEKFLDYPLKAYSSGMQVRLAFAVAATLEPEVLIIDEALSVGDAAFQQKCIGKMQQIKRDGRTILFVSHNATIVANMCQRALYLIDGKIIACGPAEEVIHRYLADTSHSLDQDLSRARRPHMGRETRFASVSIDHPNAVYHIGEPFQLRLLVESDENHGDLSIGGTINSLTGEPVATLFTRETFDIKAGEQVNLTLSITELDLAPGRYHWNLSIGRGGFLANRLDLDLVCGMPAFQVMPITLAGDSLCDWPSHAYGHLAVFDSRLEINAGGNGTGKVKTEPQTGTMA